MAGQSDPVSIWWESGLESVVCQINVLGVTAQLCSHCFWKFKQWFLQAGTSQFQYTAGLNPDLPYLSSTPSSLHLTGSTNLFFPTLSDFWSRPQGKCGSWCEKRCIIWLYVIFKTSFSNLKAFQGSSHNTKMSFVFWENGERTKSTHLQVLLFYVAYTSQQVTEKGFLKVT